MVEPENMGNLIEDILCSFNGPWGKDDIFLLKGTTVKPEDKSNLIEDIHSSFNGPWGKDDIFVERDDGEIRH